MMTEALSSPKKEHSMCKLKKSLHGLKQSPRCWNSKMDTHLKGMGYAQSITCATKCRVRRSVDGMHSPQLAYVQILACDS